MIELLKKDWFSLAEIFSNETNTIEIRWREIQKQYSLKIRHYHNLSHIDHMLSHAKSVKGKITNWENFLFAIWYHDIVYKPTKKDNEDKSAVWAKKGLKSLKIDEKSSKSIQDLIISTKNHKIQLNENNDNAYLLDIDLSILGAEWEKYQTYIRNIRKEYSIYPNFMYRNGRKKVLQHFLERKTLYFTKVFQDKFEIQARKNLTKEIKML